VLAARAAVHEDRALILPCGTATAAASTLRLITSRLARRFREKRLDNFFQIGTLALRAARLFRLVLLDGQNFAKSLAAFAANVLVKWHMLVRLGVSFLFD
jgi:hypothetical protein